MSTIVQTRTPLEPPFDSRARALAIHSVPAHSPLPVQTPALREHISAATAAVTAAPLFKMGPPSNTSPEVEQRQDNANGISPQHARDNGQSAVGATQGSKVVQTAFIHKLYSMLEDKSIENLISWSENGDSFVMFPSQDFSKVLASYFKHTNISSFVRQLNMYGFHKVSDVFHTGSSESALWEFKHGNGSFRKGDLMGLRDIKRRASRHTLIHRDSFTNTNPPHQAKPGPPPPPGVATEVPQDPEQRLAHMDVMFQDIYSRLARTEDTHAITMTRIQNLNENLSKCHQWIRQLSSTIYRELPAESPVRNDLSNIQKEIEKQAELMRASDVETTPNGGRLGGFYAHNVGYDGPVSPRGGYGYNDSRRSSIVMPDAPPPPPPFAGRPPVPPIPPQFSSSPRRFGSISAQHTSPGFSKPPLPTPPQPHPLSNVTSPPPNLARRHTSADIREHWPPNTEGSPFASGANSVHWQPSSPLQNQEAGGGDQALQSQLASYQIDGSRRPTITAADQDSLPVPSRADIGGPPAGLGVGNVSWGAGASKFPRPSFELHSAPATRRGSMASTLHSLLNPADTAEQDNEDDIGPMDDRKRKRVA